MQKQALSAHTIKPSLMAFPKTWLWLMFVSIQMLLVDGIFAQVIMVLMYVLPIVIVLIFVTYGRSYTLDKNIITKTNHITGTTLSVCIDDISAVDLKPNMFGYGHVVFTLTDGQQFKMKSIKLPKHQETLDCLNKNQGNCRIKVQSRHIQYQVF